MSNINYDIYGTPEQWTHWTESTPSGGTYGTIWGQQRIGAANWNNSDFTFYPEFWLGQQSVFRNYVTAGLFDVNVPLDNSISYTAIANPDLPQQNVMIFDYQHNTLSNSLAQTIPENVSPFAFSWYYFGTSHIMNPAYQGSLYGFDGFPNNASVFGAQGMQRISPYALWDSVYSNDWGRYNPNLRITPCVKFGVKSVILEINVVYKTTGDYPTAQTDLKTYLNHTSEWLQSHKLIAAYCIPYFRTNVNGTYLSTNAAVSSDRFGGISTLFFRPYSLQGIDIYNYTAYLSSDLNISGNLPIYGRPITDGSYTAVDVYGYHNYDSPTQTNMNSYACLYGVNRGDFVKTVSSGQISCHMELDMSVADNVEFIMRGAAAYGLFFCKAIGTLGNSGRDSGVTERWLDSEMYCGVIADDGMTYGDYTQGSDNADNQVYGWIDSTQTPFDPQNIPDTDNTKYDDETKYRQLGYFPTACNAYVCSGGAIEKLSDVIATAIRSRPDPDVPVSEYTLDNGLTNNPIDTIISIKMYPSTQVPAFGSDTAIMFGAWSNPAVTGKELAKNYGTADFTFSRSRQNGFVAAFGNSFLDYAPYTRAELIIPYCGTVQLSAADFLNHDINVRMVIDYMTGACTAFIQRDGIAVLTCSGSIGVDIPITGIQTATFDSQRLNAVLARENALNNSNTSAVGGLVSALGAVGSLMTGNVLGAVASVGGLMSSVNNMNQTGNAYQKADYDLKHLQVPVKAVQSASPLISYVYENVCRLIIYRPVLSSDYDPAIYADTVGYACLMNGKVKQFSGLTVGNINTDGIAAPEPVKAMIQKLFAAGVYL